MTYCSPEFSPGRCEDPAPQALRLVKAVRRAWDDDPAAARNHLDTLHGFLADCADLNGGLASRRDDTIAAGGLTPRQLALIETFIHANLSRTIRVARLAALAGLSPSYFGRAFKRTTGFSPHGFVMRARLTYARRLMLETPDTLSHIATVCGLADQAHLSRLFRQKFGESPWRWRRAMAAPSESLCQEGKLDTDLERRPAADHKQSFGKPR